MRPPRTNANSVKSYDDYGNFERRCRTCHPAKRARNPARTAQRARGATAGPKTHCIHGHEYTPENTRTRIHSNGTEARECRECIRIRGRRNREATKRAAELSARVGRNAHLATI